MKLNLCLAAALSSILLFRLRLQAYFDESSEDLRRAALAPLRTNALQQNSERWARYVMFSINKRNSRTFIAATEALSTGVLVIMLVAEAADIGGGGTGTGHCHIALAALFTALDHTAITR